MSPPVIRRVDTRLEVEFDSNQLAAELYGAHDRNLPIIGQRLGVRLATRGNLISILGGEQAQLLAARVLEALYALLEQGQEMGRSEIDNAIVVAERSMQPLPGTEMTGRDERSGTGDGGASAAAGQAGGGTPGGPLRDLQVNKRAVRPRSATQAAYIDALAKHELVFGLGPAGTGKTYLAVAFAGQMLVSDQVKRIILSRPAVEAGEKLGFLPGDMKEKVDPYLRPLYDALQDLLPAERVAKWLENGTIEIAPLAFMRGRTLAHSVIILDEAQNTTPTQMKMFLTRLGEGSRMVITGDLSQIDLPRGVPSGLGEAVKVLRGVDGVGFTEFTKADVVRHPLVTRVVEAYEVFESPPLDLRR